MVLAQGYVGNTEVEFPAKSYLCCGEPCTLLPCCVNSEIELREPFVPSTVVVINVLSDHCFESIF